MSIFDNLRISGSALTAQRLRMDVISNNIANAETTRGADGEPYQRKQVVFTPIQAPARTASQGRAGVVNPREQGVQVSAITPDNSAPRMVYDPGHPDADADGYVSYPDIDIITEMTDMISASRAYEANVTAINASKSMAIKALDIGRA